MSSNKGSFLFSYSVIFSGGNFLKNISVREASYIMGVSQQFIRVGLQTGRLPFGTAVKMSSRWTYYINPGKFFAYISKSIIGGDK